MPESVYLYAGYTCAGIHANSWLRICSHIGSHTYGGCGDINRNVMVPAVHFPNNPAYVYAQKYSKAIADLFKPMSKCVHPLRECTRCVRDV